MCALCVMGTQVSTLTGLGVDSHMITGDQHLTAQRSSDTDIYIYITLV